MERLKVNPATLPHGWFFHHEKFAELLETHKPQTCVEVGTWRGLSAIFIASLIQEWHGALYCVDTWCGQTQDNWNRPAGTPVMLGECAENLRVAGVAPYVRLISTTSALAARAWTLPIDFLYLDADHSYESVREDLQVWWPHLRHGGVITGDDYGHPDFPGVARAWDEFEREQQQQFKRQRSTHTTLVYGVKG